MAPGFKKRLVILVFCYILTVSSHEFGQCLMLTPYKYLPFLLVCRARYCSLNLTVSCVAPVKATVMYQSIAQETKEM